MAGSTGDMVKKRNAYGDTSITRVKAAMICTVPQTRAYWCKTQQKSVCTYRCQQNTVSCFTQRGVTALILTPAVWSSCTGRGAFVSPPRTSASCSQPPAANETKTNNTNITVLINKGKLFVRTQDILSQSKKSSRGKAGIIGNNTPT